MLQNLSLRPYEFIAEDSIVNFMALLNDKKVEIVEKIKADFNNQLSNYDETHNQIASINAIMIAIDYSNKPTKRHAPIKAVWSTKIMIIVNNNKQINISNIWLSLFINDKSHGIAVLGKQIFTVDRKYYSKYWIIDILEKSLSINSIVDSLLELK